MLEGSLSEPWSQVVRRERESTRHGDDRSHVAASRGRGEEWIRPNADYDNTRVASSEIDAENVDELNVVWTQPLTGSGPFGAFASTPLITEDGVTYDVYYSVANGYYSHNSLESTQNERLYTNSLVKLDGQSGELLWYYQALPNDFWD